MIFNSQHYFFYPNFTFEIMLETVLRRQSLSCDSLPQCSKSVDVYHSASRLSGLFSTSPSLLSVVWPSICLPQPRCITKPRATRLSHAPHSLPPAHIHRIISYTWFSASAGSHGPLLLLSARAGNSTGTKTQEAPIFPGSDGSVAALSGRGERAGPANSAQQVFATALEASPTE